MAQTTLQQRQIGYEKITDQRIMGRVPVVISLDAKKFLTVTKSVQKPFCHKTMALLNDTMLSMVKQIDGCVLGYQYSDKIILILKNDKNADPWYGNRTLPMATVASSMATWEFMSNFYQMDNPPDLEGSILWKGHAFGLPDHNEVVNYLIHHQYQCMHHSVNKAVYSLLETRYGDQTAELLKEKNMDDRKRILEEAGLDLSDFPSSYLHGSLVYKIPKMEETSEGHMQRTRWMLDMKIPLFTEMREMIHTILDTGSDVFKPERDA